MEEDNNIIDSQVSDLEQLAPIQQPVTPLAPTPQAQPDLEQLTQPAQPVLAPSTVENQNDTTEAQDNTQKEQERYNRIKEQIARGLGKDPTPSQIMDAMDKEDVQSQEAAKQKELALAEEEDNKRLALEARKDEIARLQAKGLPVERNEELDSIIEQQEIQAQDADAQTEQEAAKALALQQKIEQAQNPSDTEVQEAFSTERQSQASIIAKEEALAKDKKAAQQAADKVAQQSKEDDEEIEKNPKSGFHNPSFLQKALFIIATSASQYFFDIAGVRRKVENPLEKLIKDDMAEEANSQKLKTDSEERAFNRRLKSMEMNIKQSSAFNSSEDLKLKKEKLLLEMSKVRQSNIQTITEKAQRESVVQSIKNGTLTDPTNLSKEDKERVVRLPDGKISLADSKEAATKLREFKNTAEPALKLIARVRSLSKKGSKMSPLDRARMATNMQALVGGLRETFLGPGAMTESEYERLRDTIGNPNKIFTSATWELAKLGEVKNKLTGDLNTRYKNAGIDAPKSKREQFVKHLMSKKKGLKRESVESQIDSLVEAGKLPDYYAY